MEHNRAKCTDENNNEKKESPDSSIKSYPTPSDSDIGDDLDPDFDAAICEIIQRMKESGKKNGPVFLEIPGKIDPKYYSKRCIKNAEVGKAIPVPPTFQKITLITDPLMSDGIVLITANRATKIFYAIAKAVFNCSDALLASQAKLLYLRQIEKDYAAAKESRDAAEIRKCVKLVNKTGLEYDEAWLDDEWLMASKAFYAPMHVMYNCNRVPSNPHVFRYLFSPVVEDEPPVRIVVNNGE